MLYCFPQEVGNSNQSLQQSGTSGYYRCRKAGTKKIFNIHKSRVAFLRKYLVIAFNFRLHNYLFICLTLVLLLCPWEGRKITFHHLVRGCCCQASHQSTWILSNPMSLPGHNETCPHCRSLPGWHQICIWFHCSYGSLNLAHDSIYGTQNLGVYGQYKIN